MQASNLLKKEFHINFEAKDYSLFDSYSPGEFLRHKKFGEGIVTEVISDNQIIVRFSHAKIMLLVNCKRPQS